MTRQLRGAVVLVVYSRPKLLPKVLASIQKANSTNLPLVVIFQTGNQEVQEILEKNLTAEDHLFHVSGTLRSTINNISFNRLLGYNFAFNFLECDYVLAFEDDVLVSLDIFDFSDFIFRKYFGVKRFRGINFGSHEKYSTRTRNFYSLQRFGIHGPASGISSATWKHFQSFRIIEKGKKELFDGIFEPFIKSGFMVTPTNSRFLDIGVGGTHTSQSADDPYFEKMSLSFVEDDLLENIYQMHKVDHSWRNDVFPYSWHENLLFDLLKVCGERRSNLFFRKLERAVYKVFILHRLTIS
jgi:glycosyltransferase involved in cell wall biosynthesis